MKKQLIAAVTVASLLGFAGGTAVQAFNLGSILKVGGISVLVSKYGDSINDFLNKLLMKNGVGTDYATKVVPIVSVGTGKYIGAVQVIGPSAQVEKVKAVAQLEGEFNGIARANALIPMATTNVTNLSRVQGVGVGISGLAGEVAGERILGSFFALVLDDGGVLLGKFVDGEFFAA